MTPSLTPYRDAALRVIEAGKIAEEAAEERTPVGLVGSRLRLGTVGPLLLALADEIDAGTDRDDLESAIVNLFGNLACSAAGFVRGGAISTNGTALSILSAAASLVATFPESPSDCGPTEVVEMDPRRGNA